MSIRVGDRVRIERDETRYPSKGTWGQFRGKTGTVVEVNQDRKRPHLTEYGVVFGKVRKPHSRTGSIVSGNEVTTWFKAHEIRGLASQPQQDAPNTVPAMETTGELIGAAS